MDAPSRELFQWWALAPEIAVAALALLVLVLETTLPSRLRRHIAAVAPAGLAALIVALAPALLDAAATAVSTATNTAVPAAAAPRLLFSGMLAQMGGLFTATGPSTALARLFFLVAAFLTLLLAPRFLRRRGLPETEFAHLTLFATAALMLLAQCNHFVSFYVALEAATIGLCVLAGYNRNSGATLEAGVKYLVTAGMSGALLLFGVALLCGAAGNPVLNDAAAAAGGFDALDFGNLKTFVAAHSGHPLVLAGAALVVCGVAFKIGVFPFQLWVPDVYQGAPTPAAAFFATASKGAGVLALLLLASGPFAPLVSGTADIPATVTATATTADAVSAATGPLFALLSLMTGATLIFANLSALGQANTKRLMGLSGLSHAGFMLLAVLAVLCGGGVFAVSALLFYMAAYLAGAFTLFGVIAEMPDGARGGADADSAQTTADFQLLAERSPFLAWMLGVGAASLAGIPPTLGFAAKFLVLLAAFHAGLWWLAALALLCAGAGVYYYLAWVREAFQRVWLPHERHEELSAPTHVPLAPRLVLFALAAVLLAGGVAPCLTDFVAAPPKQNAAPPPQK
ncbi:MAG: hypothetical protein LBT53_06995 [Puniceicoccales bacterium]|jgi:NADH-quinone oxidoreductase subunit N|nr:hypothetical protein [Puniceicoccales bacterium]